MGCNLVSTELYVFCVISFEISVLLLGGGGVRGKTVSVEGDFKWYYFKCWWSEHIVLLLSCFCFFVCVLFYLLFFSFLFFFSFLTKYNYETKGMFKKNKIKSLPPFSFNVLGRYTHTVDVGY